MAFSVQFPAKEPRETGRNVQQQHAQWELYLVRTIRFGCHAEKMMFTKTRASDWDIHNYIIFICYCHARSCAPLGRRRGGTVPGVETG